MPDEEVPFQKRKTVTDQEHQEALKTLEAACDAAGEDVLSEWEEEFALSALPRLKRHDWEITEKRAHALARIAVKLGAAGLL